MTVHDQPAAANVSLVVPIHKRGDASQPGNYRPIAVGEPAMRLYAALLNQRLVAYTEAAGLRAPSQAGFRPAMSTLHPVFTLQHLLDRARHLRQPLVCCFLDLQGAYDRVPRPLLWQALARLGLHGAMPAAIQSLYANAVYAISVGGRRGAGVPSARGVKQGCPLSPTLFGLLLDGLHWELRARAPDAGPALACGRRVPDLGYADDFCLIATTAADLQRLLDIAHAHLTALGMTVSTAKTRVMVFRTGPAEGAPAPVWTCGGAPLGRVGEYKYLGVVFSAAHGLAAGFPHLCGRLQASWARLQRQFAELGDGLSLALMRQLFMQAVPPAGSYACEVWGVRRLRGPVKTARARLESAHLQLWRRLLQLPPSVHHAIVLRELRVLSPSHVWLRSTCRFWNALAQRPEGCLWRATALSDWADALTSNIKNWAWSLHQCLTDLGYPLHVDRRRLPLLSVPDVMRLHTAREQECWQLCDVCPRTCPSEGATLCKYLRWFSLPDAARGNPFFRLRLSLARVLKVVRFRLGCSTLPSVAQRNQGVCRAERVCLCCDQGAPGDEYHALFECPATRAARAPFAHLFPLHHACVR